MALMRALFLWAMWPLLQSETKEDSGGQREIPELLGNRVEPTVFPEALMRFSGEFRVDRSGSDGAAELAVEETTTVSMTCNAGYPRSSTLRVDFCNAEVRRVQLDYHCGFTSQNSWCIRGTLTAAGVEGDPFDWICTGEGNELSLVLAAGELRVPWKLRLATSVPDSALDGSGGPLKRSEP